MKTFLLSFTLLLFLAPFNFANTETPLSIEPKHPIVRIETSKGDLILKLYPEKAPKTVKNFLKYVKDDYYSGTLIHRVIDGFLIQAGGFKPGFIPKPTRKPIRNESKNGLSNVEGTVGMALTTDRHSATSQFYINLNDNLDLDYNEEKHIGYTVFGEVIDSFSTLNKIKKVKTRNITIYSKLYKREVPLYDVPEQDILIKKASILRGLE